MKTKARFFFENSTMEISELTKNYYKEQEAIFEKLKNAPKEFTPATSQYLPSHISAYDEQLLQELQLSTDRYLNERQKLLETGNKSGHDAIQTNLFPFSKFRSWLRTSQWFSAVPKPGTLLLLNVPQL